uniref:Uncharacterized protein n=1 Tax=Onchocerca volvulus TaxID=6282 RepID=A0A8R1XLM6_ONCVO
MSIPDKPDFIQKIKNHKVFWILGEVQKGKLEITKPPFYSITHFLLLSDKICTLLSLQFVSTIHIDAKLEENIMGNEIYNVDEIPTLC